MVRLAVRYAPEVLTRTRAAWLLDTSTGPHLSERWARTRILLGNIYKVANALWVIRSHCEKPVEAGLAFEFPSGVPVRQTEGMNGPHIWASADIPPPAHVPVILGGGAPKPFSGPDRSFQMAQSRGYVAGVLREDQPSVYAAGIEPDRLHCEKQPFAVVALFHGLYKVVGLAFHASADDTPGGRTVNDFVVFHDHTAHRASDAAKATPEASKRADISRRARPLASYAPFDRQHCVPKIRLDRIVPLDYSFCMFSIISASA